MRPLTLGRSGPLKLLCLGAHSDDLEIGCGGTLLRWLAEYAPVEVTWVVLSAPGERAGEARRSAQALLRGAAKREIVIGDFRDAHFPVELERLKAFMRELAQRIEPDVVLSCPSCNWIDGHADGCPVIRVPAC